MRNTLIASCILLAFGLGTPAMADHSTNDGQIIIKKIYREPLTTSRVNTASTRAVDARRAAESGVFVRPAARVRVVTNPLLQERVSRPYQPTDERAATVLVPAQRVEPRVYRERPTVIAQFVNQRFDPIYDNTGIVRAQPPVARAQKGIEPAHHRAYPGLAQRNSVYHVTSDRVIEDQPASVYREPKIYLLYPDGTLYPAPGYGVLRADDHYHHHW